MNYTLFVTSHRKDNKVFLLFVFFYEMSYY